MDTLLRLLLAVVVGVLVAWGLGFFLAGWLASFLGFVSAVIFFFSADFPRRRF